MERPPWEERAVRALDVVAGGALLYVALRLGLDHARWVSLDTRPVLDEDSMFHVARITDEWRAFRDAPGPSTLFPVGNYPPLLSWLVWLEWAWHGPSGAGLRAAQAVLTPLYVLGAGGLGWRVWGRAAAPAAGALAITVPQLWMQRSNVMLALTVTAFVALVYATAPLRFDKLRPAATLLAGAVAGLALLGHLSSLYFVAAMGVGAVVEAALHVRRERADLKPAVGRLALWTGGALLVCLPYYARSLPIILSVLGEHDQKYGHFAIPSAWHHLALLARVKHAFFLDWWQTAAMVGLGLSLLCVPFRPAVRVVLLTAVLAYAGILTFPQAHDRYLLPFVPLFGALAFAPLGLFTLPGPGRLVREGLALAVGLWAASWGLDYSAAAFAPRAPVLSLQQVAGPKAPEPLAPATEIRARLLDGPARRPWAAPAPNGGDPACGASLAAAVKEVEREWRSRWPPHFVSTARSLSGQALLADLRVEGIELLPQARLELPCPAPRCYLVATDGSSFATAAAEAGFRRIAGTAECGLWTSAR